MKKETLRQILDMAKDEKTAAEVLEMIKNYEEKYEDGTDGTTVKLKIFKAPDGTVRNLFAMLYCEKGDTHLQGVPQSVYPANNHELSYPKGDIGQ